MSKKNVVLLRVGLCESCNGFLRVFFNKMSNKYGFAMGRIAMFFWFDLFFWSWRVKTTCYQKLIIFVCSHHDQKIWCFWLSRICIYIYIYYDSIYDATLHTPFSDPDGLPKKGPQICSPNSGEGCMDAETGWNNSVVVPWWKQRDLTINHGGVLSSTMKNQDLTRFLCMFDLFDHWIWGFPKMVRKIPNWWFQYQDSPTIWGYLYVRNPQFFVWVVIWVRFVDQSWNHKCCCHFHCNYSYTIWIFNIAMENGPFTDDFPIKTSIYHGFSIAMLNNQMVGVLQFWPEPLLCNEHFPMTYHWNSPTATCQTCQIQIFVGHSMGPNMA